MTAQTANPTACDRCRTLFPVHPPGYCGGSGYAIDRWAKHVCYACAAEDDRLTLCTRDQWAGYLTHNAHDESPVPAWEVSNWPGSLKIKAYNVRKSSHACFGRRVSRFDFHFNGPDGSVWHGIVRGDMDLARCRRTKARARTLDQSGEH